MSEQNNHDFKKKVENWVSIYYTLKAYSFFRGWMAYAERQNMIFVIIASALLTGYVLTMFFGPKGNWIWIAFGLLVAILWSTSFFSKRRKDRYWDQNVLSSEALKKKIDDTMQAFSFFTDAEKEMVLNLIAVSQDKSATRETFKEELEEALKLEGLSEWNILQEMSQQLEK